MAITQGKQNKQRIEALEPSVLNNQNNITNNTTKINTTNVVLGITNDNVLANDLASINRDNALSTRIDVIEQTQFSDTSTNTNEITISKDISDIEDQDALRIVINQDTNKTQLPNLVINFDGGVQKNTYVIQSGVLQDITTTNFERGELYTFRYVETAFYDSESGGAGNPITINDSFVYNISASENIRLDALERKTQNQDATSGETNFTGNVNAGAVLVNGEDLKKSIDFNQDEISEIQNGLNIVQSGQYPNYQLQGTSLSTDINASKVVRLNIENLTIDQDNEPNSLEISIDGGVTYISILKLEGEPITRTELNEMSGKTIKLQAVSNTQWYYLGLITTSSDKTINSHGFSELRDILVAGEIKIGENYGMLTGFEATNLASITNENWSNDNVNQRYTRVQMIQALANLSFTGIDGNIKFEGQFTVVDAFDENKIKDVSGIMIWDKDANTFSFAFSGERKPPILDMTGLGNIITQNDVAQELIKWYGNESSKNGIKGTLLTLQGTYEFEVKTELNNKWFTSGTTISNSAVSGALSTIQYQDFELGNTSQVMPINGNLKGADPQVDTDFATKGYVDNQDTIVLEEAEDYTDVEVASAVRFNSLFQTVNTTVAGVGGFLALATLMNSGNCFNLRLRGFNQSYAILQVDENSLLRGTNTSVTSTTSTSTTIAYERIRT